MCSLYHLGSYQWKNLWETIPFLYPCTLKRIWGRPFLKIEIACSCILPEVTLIMHLWTLTDLCTWVPGPNILFNPLKAIIITHVYTFKYFLITLGFFQISSLNYPVSHRTPPKIHFKVWWYVCHLPSFGEGCISQLAFQQCNISITSK